MSKRILDLCSSDLKDMSKKDKLEAIRQGEGRTLVCEIFCTLPPLLGSISNVELACSFSADIIFLNDYDVRNPIVKGIKVENNFDLIKKLKLYTGRMIGIDLYVKDPILKEKYKDEWPFEGSLATLENIELAIKHGADILNIVGDPCLGVSNDEIIETIKNIPQELKDKVILISGRMNKAGLPYIKVDELITTNFLNELANVGVDIVMLPAPGSIPGFTVDIVRKQVEVCHYNNLLVLTGIGSSQEGSDEFTIRNIALNAKMSGTDMHHLGDSGLISGIASPENILNYSISIKGKRHTYRRMAMSVNR